MEIQVERPKKRFRVSVGGDRVRWSVLGDGQLREHERDTEDKTANNMKMVKFLSQRVNGQRVKESLETIAAGMKQQKQGSAHGFEGDSKAEKMK